MTPSSPAADSEYTVRSPGTSGEGAVRKLAVFVTHGMGQ